jgi:hypothetical protein
MTDTGTVLDVGLEDWMAAATAEPDWEPDDPADANKLLGALRGIQRQLDEDKAVADDTIAEVKSWRDARAEVLERRRTEIERLLEGWTRMRYAVSGGSEITHRLPNGDLTLRKGRERVAVGGDEEEQALLLEQNGYADIVVVKRAVSKSAVAKMAKAGPETSYDETPEGFVAYHAVESDTGAIIPGVMILQPSEKTFAAKPRPSVWAVPS